MSMKSSVAAFESRGVAVAAAIGLLLVAGPALARKVVGDPRYCTSTASLQFTACENEVRDDFYTASAICLNLSNQHERSECSAEAYAASQEGIQDCGAQRDARRQLCQALGEARYDPDFAPADFDDDFTNLTNPNPFFPLAIGNHWDYAGGDETVAVEVLDATKRIEGVTCIVVNDRVEEDGEVVEDTDDWFGQRKDGTVDYCGELSRELETFEGDDPETPELVGLEGSFKVGRDGAQPGTLFLGTPTVGRVYRQEWSPGDAEDAARVLSISYGFGSDPELDEFVPQPLAELLCGAGDCVVTAEFTPLEPDSFERKYYARGIGFFLEVHPDTGEILQLVDCNFDAKCGALPQP